ncbi:MAG: TlpA family protein disulfide reductase [Eubacteriaceae bacterium]|nr:TlpA family protein disulfide reductase [Eubacteriaceae bacterium]
MNIKIKTILGIILFGAFLGIAYFTYNALTQNYNAGKDPAQEGKIYAAPDFTVEDSAGNKVKLSDFKGRPVVLNFWASWCPPCKSEMPHFNTVYATVRDDVVFMMVDLVDGQRETLQKGQEYVADQGFDFPVYFDTQGQAANAYGISSIPTTFFIDSDGNIIKAYQGAIDEETLNEAIAEIIEK